MSSHVSPSPSPRGRGSGNPLSPASNIARGDVSGGGNPLSPGSSAGGGSSIGGSRRGRPSPRVGSLNTSAGASVASSSTSGTPRSSPSALSYRARMAELAAASGDGTGTGAGAPPSPHSPAPRTPRGHRVLSPRTGAGTAGGSVGGSTARRTQSQSQSPRTSHSPRTPLSPTDDASVSTMHTASSASTQQSTYEAYLLAKGAGGGRNAAAGGGGGRGAFSVRTASGGGAGGSAQRGAVGSVGYRPGQSSAQRRSPRGAGGPSGAGAAGAVGPISPKSPSSNSLLAGARARASAVQAASAAVHGSSPASSSPRGRAPGGGSDSASIASTGTSRSSRSHASALSPEYVLAMQQRGQQLRLQQKQQRERPERGAASVASSQRSGRYDLLNRYSSPKGTQQQQQQQQQGVQPSASMGTVKTNPARNASPSVASSSSPRGQRQQHALYPRASSSSSEVLSQRQAAGRVTSPPRLSSDSVQVSDLSVASSTPSSTPRGATRPSPEKVQPQQKTLSPLGFSAPSPSVATADHSSIRSADQVSVRSASEASTVVAMGATPPPSQVPARADSSSSIASQVTLKTSPSQPGPPPAGPPQQTAAPSAAAPSVVPPSPSHLGSVSVTMSQQSPMASSLFRRTVDTGTGKVVAQIPMVPSDASRFRGVAYATPRVQAAADRIEAAKKQGMVERSRSGSVSSVTGAVHYRPNKSPERTGKNKWTEGSQQSVAGMEMESVSPPRALSPDTRNMSPKGIKRGPEDAVSGDAAPKTPKGSVEDSATSPGRARPSPPGQTRTPKSPQQLFLLRAFESRTVPPAPDLPSLAGTASPPRGGSKDEDGEPEDEEEGEICPPLPRRTASTQSEGAPMAMLPPRDQGEGEEDVEIRGNLDVSEEIVLDRTMDDEIEIAPLESVMAAAASAAARHHHPPPSSRPKIDVRPSPEAPVRQYQPPPLKLSSSSSSFLPMVLPPTSTMSMDEGTEVMGLGVGALEEGSLSKSSDKESGVDASASADQDMPWDAPQDHKDAPPKPEVDVNAVYEAERRAAASAAVLNDPEMFLPALSPSPSMVVGGGGDAVDQVLGMRSPKSPDDEERKGFFGDDVDDDGNKVAEHPSPSMVEGGGDIIEQVPSMRSAKSPLDEERKGLFGNDVDDEGNKVVHLSPSMVEGGGDAIEQVLSLRSAKSPLDEEWQGSFGDDVADEGKKMAEHPSPSTVEGGGDDAIEQVLSLRSAKSPPDEEWQGFFGDDVVDEGIMADVGKFIDKLQQRPVPEAPQSLLSPRSTTAGSSVGAGVVDPETLAGIGAFVDSVAKGKAKREVPTNASADSGGDSRAAVSLEGNTDQGSVVNIGSVSEKSVEEAGAMRDNNENAGALDAPAADSATKDTELRKEENETSSPPPTKGLRVVTDPFREQMGDETGDNDAPMLVTSLSSASSNNEETAAGIRDFITFVANKSGDDRSTVVSPTSPTSAASSSFASDVDDGVAAGIGAFIDFVTKKSGVEKAKMTTPADIQDDVKGAVAPQMLAVTPTTNITEKSTVNDEESLVAVEETIASIQETMASLKETMADIDSVTKKVENKSLVGRNKSTALAELAARYNVATTAKQKEALAAAKIFIAPDAGNTPPASLSSVVEKETMAGTDPAEKEAKSETSMGDIKSADVSPGLAPSASDKKTMAIEDSVPKKANGEASSGDKGSASTEKPINKEIVVGAGPLEKEAKSAEVSPGLAPTTSPSNEEAMAVEDSVPKADGDGLSGGKDNALFIEAGNEAMAEKPINKETAVGTDSVGKEAKSETFMGDNTSAEVSPRLAPTPFNKEAMAVEDSAPKKADGEASPYDKDSSVITGACNKAMAEKLINKETAAATDPVEKNAEREASMGDNKSAEVSPGLAPSTSLSNEETMAVEDSVAKKADGEASKADGEASPDDKDSSVITGACNKAMAEKLINKETAAATEASMGDNKSAGVSPGLAPSTSLSNEETMAVGDSVAKKADGEASPDDKDSSVNTETGNEIVADKPINKETVVGTDPVGKEAVSETSMGDNESTGVSPGSDPSTPPSSEEAMAVEDSAPKESGDKDSAFFVGTDNEAMTSTEKPFNKEIAVGAGPVDKEEAKSETSMGYGTGADVSPGSAPSTSPSEDYVPKKAGSEALTDDKDCAVVIGIDDEVSVGGSMGSGTLAELAAGSDVAATTIKEAVAPSCELTMSGNGSMPKEAYIEKSPGDSHGDVLAGIHETMASIEETMANIDAVARKVGSATFVGGSNSSGTLAELTARYNMATTTSDEVTTAEHNSVSPENVPDKADREELFEDNRVAIATAALAGLASPKKAPSEESSDDNHSALISASSSDTSNSVDSYVRENIGEFIDRLARMNVKEEEKADDADKMIKNVTLAGSSPISHKVVDSIADEPAEKPSVLLSDASDASSTPISRSIDFKVPNETAEVLDEVPDQKVEQGQKESERGDEDNRGAAVISAAPTIASNINSEEKDEGTLADSSVNQAVATISAHSTSSTVVSMVVDSDTQKENKTEEDDNQCATTAHGVAASAVIRRVDDSGEAQNSLSESTDRSAEGNLKEVQAAHSTETQNNLIDAPVLCADQGNANSEIKEYENDNPSQYDSEYEDADSDVGSVAPEIKAGISAFIDSLQKGSKDTGSSPKGDTPGDAYRMDDMYLSSDSDLNDDHSHEIVNPETEAELDAFITTITTIEKTIEDSPSSDVLITATEQTGGGSSPNLVSDNEAPTEEAAVSAIMEASEDKKQNTVGTSMEQGEGEDLQPKLDDSDGLEPENVDAGRGVQHVDDPATNADPAQCGYTLDGREWVPYDAGVETAETQTTAMETIGGTYAFLPPPNDVAREGGKTIYYSVMSVDSAPFTYTFDDADGPPDGMVMQAGDLAIRTSGKTEATTPSGASNDASKEEVNATNSVRSVDSAQRADTNLANSMDSTTSPLTYLPSSPVASNLVGINLLQAPSTSFSYTRKDESFDGESDEVDGLTEELAVPDLQSLDAVSGDDDVGQSKTTVFSGKDVEKDRRSDDAETGDGTGPLDVTEKDDDYLDTIPEGSSAEELSRLNLCVKKAAELVDSNDLSIEKMQDVLLAARKEGVPYDIILEIFEASLHGGKPKSYKLISETTGAAETASANDPQTGPTMRQIAVQRSPTDRSDPIEGNRASPADEIEEIWKSRSDGGHNELEGKPDAMEVSKKASLSDEIEKIWKARSDGGGMRSVPSDDSSDAFIPAIKSFGSIESINEDDAISEFLTRLEEGKNKERNKDPVSSDGSSDNVNGAESAQEVQKSGLPSSVDACRSASLDEPGAPVSVAADNEKASAPELVASDDVSDAPLGRPHSADLENIESTDEDDVILAHQSPVKAGEHSSHDNSDCPDVTKDNTVEVKIDRDPDNPDLPKEAPKKESSSNDDSDKPGSQAGGVQESSQKLQTKDSSNSGEFADSSLQSCASANELDSPVSDFVDEPDAPEGASVDELCQLNFYIRKAAELMQTDNLSKEEMERIMQAAKEEGVPEDIVLGIFGDSMSSDVKDVASNEAHPNSSQESDAETVNKENQKDESHHSLSDRDATVTSGSDSPTMLVGMNDCEHTKQIDSFDDMDAGGGKVEVYSDGEEEKVEQRGDNCEESLRPTDEAEKSADDSTVKDGEAGENIGDLSKPNKFATGPDDHDIAEGPEVSEPVEREEVPSGFEQGTDKSTDDDPLCGSVEREEGSVAGQTDDEQEEETERSPAAGDGSSKSTEDILAAEDDSKGKDDLSEEDFISAQTTDSNIIEAQESDIRIIDDGTQGGEDNHTKQKEDELEENCDSTGSNDDEELEDEPNKESVHSEEDELVHMDSADVCILDSRPATAEMDDKEHGKTKGQEDDMDYIISAPMLEGNEDENAEHMENLSEANSLVDDKEAEVVKLETGEGRPEPEPADKEAEEESEEKEDDLVRWFVNESCPMDSDDGSRSEEKKESKEDEKVGGKTPDIGVESSMQDSLFPAPDDTSCESSKGTNNNLAAVEIEPTPKAAEANGNTDKASIAGVGIVGHDESPEVKETPEKDGGIGKGKETADTIDGWTALSDAKEEGDAAGKEVVSDIPGEEDEDTARNSSEGLIIQNDRGISVSEMRMEPTSPINEHDVSATSDKGEIKEELAERDDESKAKHDAPSSEQDGDPSIESSGSIPLRGNDSEEFSQTPREAMSASGSEDSKEGNEIQSSEVEQTSDTLATLAMNEFISRFAPPEGLPDEDKAKLDVYMGKAAEKVHSKVPIKEAARDILRASRKDGVHDTMVVKIFQCLKVVEDNREHELLSKNDEHSNSSKRGSNQNNRNITRSSEIGQVDTKNSVDGPLPSLPKSKSEESGDASTADSVDFEAKFGTMEQVDQSDDIQAFLTRFKTLKEGGHFPDANVDALKNISQESSAKDDSDAVEVDLVHGFVKKDLSIADKELTEEEKLWSEGPEKDLFRKYDDFLKKMPVEVKKPGDLQASSRDFDKYLTKQEVTEVRDVNSGDAEVYLMDESVVEVAYVDEEEEKRAEEKRAQEKIRKKGSKKSLAQTDAAMEGKEKHKKGRVNVFKKPGEKLAALEKMFEERDKKIMRAYSKKNAQLDHWVSPWERRYRVDQEATETNIKGQGGAPQKIDGVAAAAAMCNLPRRKGRRLLLPVTQQWQLSYKERTKAHTGYFDVDCYSLYDSSLVAGEYHRLDDVPWEHRDVKQRFLHEKDIAFSRNWFGALIKSRGNDRNFEPVCHPRSMRMPMENIPDPGEWTEDWYTTWQSRKENPNNLKLFEMDENMEGSDKEDDNESDGTEEKEISKKDDEDSYWEEDPEVGELCTVRLKVGERVSRVTWRHTSSLRRSRWRRKYFPKGVFPFD